MVPQLRAGREQKAWQPFWDWHLVWSLPPPFVLVSAHFHPSIASLFNWLCVKVLLSASTCPCHSKQRQRGDAAASLLSLASSLSSAFFSNFLLFCLFFIFAPLPFFLWQFSPSLCHSGTFFGFSRSVSSILVLFSELLFSFLGLATNGNHRCLCSAPFFSLLLFPFSVIGPTE